MAAGERLGRSVLELVTDPTKLRAGLAAARAETLSTLGATQAAITSIGTNLTQAGHKLTTGITVPVLGIGAAVFKVAGDFETSLDHIVGLVGVGRDQVNAWKPEIEAIGVATGKGPNELAKALYFITSAGLRGDAALKALDASAKASAAGLGDVAVVADAVTSAVNSYAKTGLTAASATDVLVAAVRDGKVEASALAPVLGRLLPTASALGIQFSQVAGTMAVMTRTGLDASEAATSIQAIMTTLLKPSKMAADVLGQVGLSMADLRKEAASGPEGLINVMRTLNDALGGDDEALTKVIPNVRAFRGVMNVLAQDSSTVDGVLQDVAHSAGLTEDAFAAVADSAQFKVDQALSKLQGDLIALGADVLPVVVKAIDSVVDAVHGAVKGFEDLPQPVRDTIITVLGLAAVVGPILVILGSIVGAVGSLIGAGTALAGFITATLLPRLIAVGTAFGAWAIEALATAIFATGIPALQALAVALLGVEASAGPLIILIAAIGALVALANVASSDMVNHLADLDQQGKLTADQLDRIAHATGRTTAELRAAIDAEEARRAAADATAKAQGDAAAEADRRAIAEHIASERMDDATSAEHSQVLAIDKVADTWNAYRKTLHDSLVKALGDVRQHTADVLAAVQKFRSDLESSFKGAIDAAHDAEETQINIKLKLAELASAEDEYTKHHKGWTAEQILQYRLQRIETLKELAELKLHAALIGTDMQKEQGLTALLTSKDMKAGLTSKFPEVKASYQALQGTILDDLQTLADKGGPAGLAAAKQLALYLNPKNKQAPLHDAGLWGAATAQAYAQAMIAELEDQKVQLRAVMKGLGSILQAFSPPGPESPLHFIDVWGRKTGEAWGQPFIDAIAGVAGRVRVPLGDVAGAISGWSPPGLAIAASHRTIPNLPGSASAVARAHAGSSGPLVGVLNVDARGHSNPAAVGASVKQAIADGMADVLRDQAGRGFMEPAI